MRMIVFFDLPTITYSDQKEYRKFKKNLINEGFIMMQESVYCKLALNMSVVNSMKVKIDKFKPQNGLIQLLVITEKQYASIDYVIGTNSNNKIDSTDRLVILWN